MIPNSDSPGVPEIAWLAGYLDGEGYIGFLTTPRVMVSNTHRPTLDFLARTYGGHVIPKTGGGPNRRPAYAWQVTGDEARELLRRVMPYLKEKGRQAALVLSITPSVRGRPLTDAQRRQRERVHAQLSSLRHAIS